MLSAGCQIALDGFALIVAVVRSRHLHMEVMLAYRELQFRDLVHFYGAENGVPLIVAVPVEGVTEPNCSIVGTNENGGGACKRLKVRAAGFTGYSDETMK